MGDISVNKKALLAAACLCLLEGCAVLETKGAVIGCQAADAATTVHAIDLGAREANPVVKWLLEKFGPDGFVAAKAGATALFLKVYPEVSSGLVILINGLTCAVAVRNALIAAELQRKVDE